MSLFTPRSLEKRSHGKPLVLLILFLPVISAFGVCDDAWRSGKELAHIGLLISEAYVLCTQYYWRHMVRYSNQYRQKKTLRRALGGLCAGRGMMQSH